MEAAIVNLNLLKIMVIISNGTPFDHQNTDTKRRENFQGVPKQVRGGGGLPMGTIV